MFSNYQITNWRRYERVRASGKWNIWDERAMIESGLERADYIFCLKNYQRLKLQSEREARSKSEKTRRRRQAGLSEA